MIGSLGFSVFQFWSFLRSYFLVFALKIFGFSVVVSNAVFDFPFYDIRYTVFINKKAVFRFLLFACLVPRPRCFGSLFSAVFRF